MDQSKTVRFDSQKVDIQAEDYRTLCIYRSAEALLEMLRDCRDYLKKHAYELQSKKAPDITPCEAMQLFVEADETILTAEGK